MYMCTLFQESVSIKSEGEDIAHVLRGHCYGNHRRSLLYGGFQPSHVTRNSVSGREEGKEEEEEGGKEKEEEEEEEGKGEGSTGKNVEKARKIRHKYPPSLAMLEELMADKRWR